jgi:hypothetical protein
MASDCYSGAEQLLGFSSPILSHFVRVCPYRHDANPSLQTERYLGFRMRARGEVEALPENGGNACLAWLT